MRPNDMHKSFELLSSPLCSGGRCCCVYCAFDSHEAFSCLDLSMCVLHTGTADFSSAWIQSSTCFPHACMQVLPFITEHFPITFDRIQHPVRHSQCSNHQPLQCHSPFSHRYTMSAVLLVSISSTTFVCTIKWVPLFPIFYDTCHCSWQQ